MSALELLIKMQVTAAEDRREEKEERRREREETRRREQRREKMLAASAAFAVTFLSGVAAGRSMRDGGRTL